MVCLGLEPEYSMKGADKSTELYMYPNQNHSNFLTLML